MSRNITLANLRTAIATQGDFTISASGRYSPTSINFYVNSSIQRFRERVTNEGITHYLTSASGTITSGSTSPYSFKELDVTTLLSGAQSCVRVYGVDLTVNGVVKTLAHRPFQERNDYGAPTVTGEPACWAMYQTTKIAIMPAPNQSYAVTVWYLPMLADLTSDSDAFDGVAGWEQYIIWDCVCRLIARDQYAAAYAQAVQLRDEIIQDILRSATKVTSAGGAIVGRDTLRASGFGRRAFCGPVVSGGSGLPPDGSVTNAMLASAPEATIKGRARGAGAGSPTDLVPAQAAAIVAVYSGGAAGLVPTGAGSTTLFLREDATWAAPSVGGSVSGLTLSQIQNIAPDRVLGRSTAGTGAVEQLRGQQVASMIGVFTGAAHGLVPFPSGGFDSTLFLAGDATWRTPAGGAGGGTGASPSALFFFPPLTTLGNSSSASGVSEFLSRGQVASLLPLFSTASGSTRGLVYSPTAGVAGRFLRDDGSFQGVPSSVATGLLLSQLELSNPLSVHGRFTLGTGATEQLDRGQVASLLPLFSTASGATRGLVYSPTAGVANRFLRDDGTFQGVPSFIPTGIDYTQLLPMPEAVLGRLGASGVPTFLSGTAVATMLPNFTVTGKGTVPPPGSLSNLFLRDDGAWASPPGGGGGANNPGGPTGSFQWNQGSGIFAGASGFNFTASGISNVYPFLMPTGSIQMGASGGVPEVEIASINGRLSVGFGLTPSGGDLLFGRSASSNNIQILARDSDGYGALREAVALDRRNAPSGALDLYFGNPTNTRSVNLRGFAATINAANPTGGIRGQLGSNNLEAFAARPGHHAWGVSGSQKLGLDERGLNLWGQLGVQLNAHSASSDKLGMWTASGYSNVATGITISASGYQLSVGSGGPELTASGMGFRGGDIGGVRRINGLDGIKVFGNVPGGGAASGTQEIVVASGTAFIVPESVTTGQVYALIPTLAVHGDTVLLENRTGISHMVNNSGTGMGTPSAFVATLLPSGGISFRFASGAWEYANRYKLGGG